jgi:hypothetical protein
MLIPLLVEPMGDEVGVPVRRRRRGVAVRDKDVDDGPRLLVLAVRKERDRGTS